MFSAAFPKIPFTGSNEVVDKETPESDDKATPPPAIPFDALLLVSEEAREQSTTISGAVEPWQTRIVNDYAAVMPGIDTDDAREFLAALCFLATRFDQKQ